MLGNCIYDIYVYEIIRHLFEITWYYHGVIMVLVDEDADIQSTQPALEPLCRPLDLAVCFVALCRALDWSLGGIAVT